MSEQQLSFGAKSTKVAHQVKDLKTGLLFCSYTSAKCTNLTRGTMKEFKPVYLYALLESFLWSFLTR
jgi:hypothetical protein